MKRQRSKQIRLIGLVLGGIVLSMSGLVALSFRLDATLSSQRVITATSTDNPDRDFRGTLWFNDTPGETIISDRIVQLMNSATDSIDLVLYSLSIQSIVDAAEAATDRGVRVRLITDVNKHDQHARYFGEDSAVELIEIGIATGDEDESSGYMHHKYVLIDGDTDHAVYIGGSLNMTRLQELYDPGHMLETTDSDFIASYRAETKRLASGIRSHHKIAKGGYRPFDARLQYHNGWVETWFSPGLKGNNASDRLLELIGNASRSLDVMIWQVTSPSITQALLEKARQGVRVRIITDDYYIWGEDSAFRVLARAKEVEPDLPLELISDIQRTIDPKDYIKEDGYFNPYVHQHTLIADDSIVFTGSNNWSFNGFLSSDESMLVTNVDWIVEQFTASFRRHYEELQPAELRYAKHGSEFTLPDIAAYPTATSLHLYREDSEKLETPEPCTIVTAEQLQGTFEIPADCQGRQMVMYLYDETFTILAANRLY